MTLKWHTPYSGRCESSTRSDQSCCCWLFLCHAEHVRPVSNFIAFKKWRFFSSPFCLGWHLAKTQFKTDVWEEYYIERQCMLIWSTKMEQQMGGKSAPQNRTALTILVTLSMTLLRRTPARSTRFNFVWKMDLSRLGTVWILYRYQHCIFQSNLQL